MGNRKGTRADLAPCKGTCGRMTYASTVQIDDAPEAVMRYKQGYCGQCWDREQLNRPMTQQEIRALEALEVFIGKRRARLARRQRQLEQFRKRPIFTSIEVNYNEPIRIPMPEVPNEEPKDKAPKPERKSPAGRKMTLDYNYPEGSIHFYEDSRKAWCYTLSGPNGEILGKNEYGYRGLKHAKIRSRIDAAALGWYMG